MRGARKITRSRHRGGSNQQPALLEREDCTPMAWYPSLYAPHAREGRMIVTIGRRGLLAALGGAVAWPLAARAQQPGKLPTIGYLGTTTASAWGPWTAAFVQRLDELGWTEGRTIATEYRWADGRSERFAEIATEFVLLKVDVIVTGGNAAVAAKQATSVIPIVFVLGDPVGTGLIANLARPGGNITGLTNQQPNPILLASDSKFCAISFPVSAGWRSWPMLTTPLLCRRWRRFVGLRAHSASMSSTLKSGEPRISRLPSNRSMVVRMHFTSSTTRS